MAAVTFTHSFVMHHWFWSICKERILLERIISCWGQNVKIKNFHPNKCSTFFTIKLIEYFILKPQTFIFWWKCVPRHSHSLILWKLCDFHIVCVFKPCFTINKTVGKEAWPVSTPEWAKTMITKLDTHLNGCFRMKMTLVLGSILTTIYY